MRPSPKPEKRIIDGEHIRPVLKEESSFDELGQTSGVDEHIPLTTGNRSRRYTLSVLALALPRCQFSSRCQVLSISISMLPASCEINPWPVFRLRRETGPESRRDCVVREKKIYLRVLDTEDTPWCLMRRNEQGKHELVFELFRHTWIKWPLKEREVIVEYRQRFDG